MPDTRTVVKQLIDKGLQPVRILAGEKNPLDDGWTKATYKPKPTDWRPDDNVGLHLIGLADVDLDSPQARAAAPYLLPETFLRHGRPAKPISHWW